MNILKESEHILPYMVEKRRYLHENPELSGKELKTVEYISNELSILGIKNTVIQDGGILGFIEGKKKGKTVLLRADMDALPVLENSCNLKREKKSVSKNSGVSHVCGHDGHMAVLLGAARILQNNRDNINGKIILMFERGEEGTFNAAYIHRYMEDNGITADTSWGIHLYAPLETGKIFIKKGPVMAGVMRFKATVSGKGGHGARPDEAISPIDCFAAIHSSLIQLRMKYINPFSPLTFSIGTVHSGQMGNVIPETLEFSGTVRFFDMNQAEKFGIQMKNTIDGIAKAYNCDVDFNLSRPCFPVINDESCVEIAKQSIAEILGNDSLVETDPWMVSESMCLNLKLWPGVFALVGIKNREEGTGAENHNAQFDVDENALIYGASATVAYALGFLDSDKNPTTERWDKGMLNLYAEAGLPVKAFE